MIKVYLIPPPINTPREIKIPGKPRTLFIDLIAFTVLVILIQFVLRIYLKDLFDDCPLHSRDKLHHEHMHAVILAVMFLPYRFN